MVQGGLHAEGCSLLSRTTLAGLLFVTLLLLLLLLLLLTGARLDLRAQWL